MNTTRYELLEKLNGQNNIKIKEDTLWSSILTTLADNIGFTMSKVPFPLLITERQDKTRTTLISQMSDTSRSLDYAKDDIRKMIYKVFQVEQGAKPIDSHNEMNKSYAFKETIIIERIINEVWLALHTWQSTKTDGDNLPASSKLLSQDTTTDSLLWSSPFYSKQSQETMIDDKSLSQPVKLGENKATTSFEFQYLKPTMTEACRYRMKQQHREPQLISEASQVLLRGWQSSDKPSVIPSHIYGTPKEKPRSTISKNTPNKGKTTAPLAAIPAAILPTVSNVSTKVVQSPGQKAAIPPRRIRHVAGFGKSQSASQNIMSTSTNRLSMVNGKSERLSSSQPVTCKHV
jgi:hypothetical protein